jgi:4-hydroxybutyrate dehydrogenase/sulfolactaldehyde 3-reductase
MADAAGIARGTVAFIGLGTMGMPMAANLARAGYPVLGVDANPALQSAAEGRGIVWSGDLAAAVATADFVITMLPSGAIVRSTACGPDGIAAHLRPSALYIDMSTIAPADTDAVAQHFHSRSLQMVDAPVARSSKEAEEGKLLIMAGGSADDIERVQPLFGLLADSVIHCGPVGHGIRMKLVNNYMSLTINVVTAQALALAQRVGIELDLAYRVMSQTVAGKGHLTTTYPVKAFKGDLEPGFMIDLARKDIGLILDMAAGTDVPADTARAALVAYDAASRHGRGRQDHTAIYDMCMKGGPWN